MIVLDVDYKSTTVRLHAEITGMDWEYLGPDHIPGSQHVTDYEILGCWLDTEKGLRKVMNEKFIKMIEDREPLYVILTDKLHEEIEEMKIANI